MADISVVIPTRGRADLLRETLDYLAAQSEPPREIQVVVDGADPDTEKLAAEYKSSIPVEWTMLETCTGPANARNVGARKAKGELLLFVDDDVRVEPDWIEYHARHHSELADEKLVVIGPCEVHEFVREPSSFVEKCMQDQFEFDVRIREHFADKAANARLGPDVWVGMNSSLKRSAFLASGGFDTRLRVGEDSELGMRLLESGYSFLMEAKAVVVHRSSKNLVEHRAQTEFELGVADVYRAVEKNERGLQTRRLARRFLTRGFARWKEAAAFHFPGTVGSAVKGIESLANATHSRFLFRRAHAVALSHHYWRGVRSTGITTGELRKLTGEARPVLAYHSVHEKVDETEVLYNISRRRFWHSIDILRRLGYSAVTDIEHPAQHKREVVITFDDGYENLYSEVFPRFQQAGLKAIAFVVVDRLGKSGDWDPGINRPLISVQQMREMHAYGFRFGSHSLTHQDLTRLSPMALRREVSDSKARLEDFLGSAVELFAYPWGQMNDRVRAAVGEAGYTGAVSTISHLSKWDDRFSIPRISVSELDTPLNLFVKLKTGRDLRQSEISPRKLIRWYLRGLDAFAES